jgi:hypothetical protein
MRILSFISALLLACGTTATAWAADLTKIERTIAKEPVYETKTPKYCLLVFGPEAKMRVWLVLDGNVLYVDRNGDGDLTGKAERVEAFNRRFDGVDLSLGDGKVHASIYRLWVEDNGRVRVNRKAVKPKAALAGTDRLPRTWMNCDPIEFADRPQDAPVVHMDGPMTLKPMDNNQVLIRGTSCPFPVIAGTPGLGKGTFTDFLLFRPGDPTGVAEIVFPHRDADSKPIVVKVELKTPE